MTIDFFVHPQYPEKNGIHRCPNIVKFYGKYFQHLLYNLETSNLPILIKGKGDAFFETELPTENQFNSNNYGEITSFEEWQRFIELIKGHESEEMRINGAYFGQCVRNFALQLFTYLKTGENMFTENDSNGVSRIRTQSEFQHFGDFLKSNVKYGAVLHHYRHVKILKELPSFKNLPFGNVNHQFMDSQTRVYF